MKLIAASLLGIALLLTRAEGPPDQFVVVNGVRLHYLDWGGRGETVVFLAGLGDSVHRFDSFAPKFFQDPKHADKAAAAIRTRLVTAEF